MSAFWLFILVVALALVGFVLGRARAMSDAGGDVRRLHSLPSYYGANVMLSTLIPGLFVLVAWVIMQPLIIQGQVAAMIPADAFEDTGALNLILSDVRRVADGLDVAVGQGALSAAQAGALTAADDVRGLMGAVGVAVGGDISPFVLDAAQTYRSQSATAQWLMTALTLGVSLIGFVLALKATSRNARARNKVETVVRTLLLAAARWPF